MRYALLIYIEPWDSTPEQDTEVMHAYRLKTRMRQTWRNRLVAEKPFVEPDLRLTAQVVVQPGENNDELVSGIGGLADEPRVGTRFARLYVAHDKSAPIPRSAAARIFETPKNFVDDVFNVRHGNCFKRLHKIEPVAAPETPLYLTPPCRKPRDVIIASIERTRII